MKHKYINTFNSSDKLFNHSDNNNSKNNAIRVLMMIIITRIITKNNTKEKKNNNDSEPWLSGYRGIYIDCRARSGQKNGLSGTGRHIQV